jgi:hypothetical protein
MKTGRNESCPCGSGQKYKKCCLAKDTAAEAATLASSAPASTDSKRSDAPGAARPQNRVQGPPRGRAAPTVPSGVRRRAV